MERLRPDIVIRDRESRPIIIAEVKSNGPRNDDSRALEQLKRYVTAFGDDDTFAILADRESIRIFRGDPSSDPAPVTLPASAILRYYDAEFDSHALYESYVASLIEAWLNDLSIHWKSEHPPSEDAIPPALLTRLQAA
jgi:hypothetical protein